MTLILSSDFGVPDVHFQRVAHTMRQRAKYSPTFDGAAEFRNQLLLRTLTRDDLQTQARLMFSRDVGHHTSGWMKNPDYERCWHLSISYRDRRTGIPIPHEMRVSERWCRAFFRDDLRYAWCESPKSPRGIDLGVWHWRVFTDEHWRAILPRGEVYSTEFTELGWKSATELFDLGQGGGVISTVDPS